ncbi:MAG TPA: Fe(3+) ABC transporter substrate-binding protein [Methylomirabilota bacterium]|jgi:iron(III) transport system substrate-binding protein|nr:Fe(3+) ABC transporter substrate-binding protein [Methylomirabilota bacterium]
MIPLRLFAASGLLLGLAVAGARAAELNIYSARQEALIKPQLDAFTEETGVRVNLVTGDAKELVQRLKSEAANSPADLLFTADAGNLYAAATDGLCQKIQSGALTSSIPAAYRDPDGAWFGLGIRARPIFYVPGKVDPGEIKSYEDLADPKWKGRILVRSSSHIYNQSLLASLIAHDGAEAAEAWAKGVAANLARKPQGGDRDQIKAAAAGEGDVVIANSYYYAQMLTSDDPQEREAAQKLKVIWPNQGDRGTHVNVSGACVTAHAPHRDEAVKLLEFLVSDEAQKIYAEKGQEFPVKAGISPSETLRGLGAFKADELNLAELGKHNAEAVRIFDRVGWP